MSHTCHAVACNRHCPPEYLMCPFHWRMVPAYLQSGVWRHYRKGQCDDMDVSREWVLAAYKAICAVAVKEGHYTAKRAAKIIATRMKLLDKSSKRK